MDLDPYVVQDSAQFVNQLANFVRVQGVFQLPYQLMYGQNRRSGMGFFYNRVYVSISNNDKKNILEDKNLETSDRLGIAYSVNRKLDALVSFQRMEKLKSERPYLINLGLSYNLFDRISKSHLNLIFSFSELKKHEDMYVKSFYLGGLYKAFGARLDYSLNFGINRIHGKIFPDEHPAIRIKKIENNFVYQIGFTYHLHPVVHLQAGYLKATYSVYTLGILVTNQ